MRFGDFSFGVIQIDGVTYQGDVVIDRGQVRPRKKGPSKGFRESFGHTPLSAAEKIPWKCRRLIIGTGAYGSLPVMEEVAVEARRRGVELIAVRTAEAIVRLRKGERGANAVLHITC